MWFSEIITEKGIGQGASLVIFLNIVATLPKALSSTIEKAQTVSIEFVAKDGTRQVLKSDLALLDGEIIDSSVMNKNALVAFYEKEIELARMLLQKGFGPIDVQRDCSLSTNGTKK